MDLDKERLGALTDMMRQSLITYDHLWGMSFPNVVAIHQVWEQMGWIVFPWGTPPDRLRLKCIIDPIDGTRTLMYDKSSVLL